MVRGNDTARQMTTERWSRDWIILVLFAIFLVVIAGRLIYIQVIVGPGNAESATLAHTSETTLYARRGTIYDRNGEVIASNVDAKTIDVNPRQVNDPDKLARILFEVLGPSTGKTERDYRSIVTQENTSFAFILRKADMTLANELEGRLSEEGITGVHFTDDTKRVYPNGDIGSQIVGVVNIDDKGIAGLELQYDELLKGQNGRVELERGRGSIPLIDGEVSRTDAVDGTDIVTSVDINLQGLCETALLGAIESTEAQGGSVTVMDASNGEIYAACSYTRKSDEELAEEREELVKRARKAQEAESTTQGERPAQGEPSEPAVNAEPDIEEPEPYKLETGKLASVTDVYEPGSTYKAFTAYSVLANNPDITPNSVYGVPYALEVYDTVITDSHDHPFEEMSITRILAESSNTGITLVSREVNLSDLYDSYSAFGFGKKTGCDFPGDATGQLENSRDWDGVQSSNITFGQGLSVSPLQLVRAYGALEQGGVLSVPHFLIDVPNDAAKARELTSDLVKRETVADATACAQVSEMLTHVVTEGTGEAAAVDGFTVTGKTGTAEVASAYGGYEENAYFMSFCGWLYGSSSDLICLVVVNRPLTNLGAGGLCGPVFSEIMSYAANRYQIDAQDR